MSGTTAEGTRENSIAATLLERLIVVRKEEIAGVLWSFAYFFLVLAAYFVIRPIRDTMGVAGGVRNLAWLFTGTLAGMILLHPLYTSLVSRYPRQKFVPFTYRFFIANLVLFFVMLKVATDVQSVWIGRIFYIWTSVFNLFVVTVFWSFMADAFRPSQSKRVFGLVAVGGTLGAVTGGTITALLVRELGEVNLLLVSAFLLELAARASNRLAKEEPRLAVAALEEERENAAGVAAGAPGGAAAGGDGVKEEEGREAARRASEVVGGGVFDGVRQVFRSPYLLGIAALMMFFSIVSTFLYFQRMSIAETAFAGDQAGQTQLFAVMETVVQALTALIQVFLTGRIIKWLGIGVSLALLPVVSMIGFAILGVYPVLAVVVAFEVIRRAANFAIQRPTREVLYTVLPREEKYKAKNLNDTFVYRLGDQTGAWSYTLMGGLGLGLSALAFTMVPFSLLWFFLAMWLGREQGKRQAATAHVKPAGVASPD